MRFMWTWPRPGTGGQQPPYHAFWGARYAVMEDPDGERGRDREPGRP